MRPSLRPTVHDSLRSWSRRNRMRAESRWMFAAHIFPRRQHSGTRLFVFVLEPAALGFPQLASRLRRSDRIYHFCSFLLIVYVVESIRGQGLSLPRFLPCFPFPWPPRSTGRRPEYRAYRQPVQSGSGCLHPRDWRIVFATFLIGTGSPCLQIVGDLFHLREVDIFRYRRFQSDGGGGGLELRVTFHAACLVRHVLHGERGAWSSVHRNGSGARLSWLRWG